MGRQYRLWIEEQDKAVWHGITRPEGGGEVRAGCGWELSIYRSRLWPVKPGEEGPPEAQRCHDCLKAE